MRRKKQKLRPVPMPQVKHLFTDASLITDRRIVGWAAMLIDGLDSWVEGGLVGGSVTLTTAAEIEAVTYAVRAFVKAGSIVPGDTIITHSDSREACELMLGIAKPPTNPQIVNALDRVLAAIREAEIIIVGKWVKGHQQQETDDWRGLINRRVDIESRRRARDERHRQIEAKKGKAA